ncbi:MAG: GNAT family N-acetyltransferase, partial [Anaerolineae bacterium]|nr:GNAT family N-acetyltransferase [Anaerolineae bacterium]
MKIVELQTEDEFRAAFPVLKELRPHLDEDEYFDLLWVMRRRGYRMFGVREDEEVVAIVGVEIAINFHQGRHLWVYNLVALEKVRHKGYGSK